MIWAVLAGGAWTLVVILVGIGIGSALARVAAYDKGDEDDG